MATRKKMIFALAMMFFMAGATTVEASGFSADFEVEDGNFVEQHIHEFTTSSVTATCTSTGSVITSCSCGDSSEESIPALGHDYVTETVDATCTTGGKVITTCTRCGDSSTEGISALGHDYVTETVDATATEAGSITTSCSRCGDSSSQVIPATGAPESVPEPVVPSEPAVVVLEEETHAVIEEEPVAKATYSQKEKVMVVEATPAIGVADVETVIAEAALPLAQARETNVGLLWFLLPLIIFILLFQYHLVLVARDENGEEDVTLLMFSWSVKRVMKKLAKLRRSNPDAELRIIHFFRGRSKRVVYSWSAEAEASEYMSRHEAKVAETVLGFLYNAEGEAVKETGAVA